MRVLLTVSDKMAQDIEQASADLRLETGVDITRLGVIRMLLGEALGARMMLPEWVPRLKLAARAYLLDANIGKHKAKEPEIEPISDEEKS